MEREKAAGRAVPGIESNAGLVVRVVHDWMNNAAYRVDPVFRKLVAQCEGKTEYPVDIPCRQRVIALFQVRVHVCMFACLHAYMLVYMFAW